jgi:hypothetical protein
MDEFSRLQVDPLEGTEIMEQLGTQTYDLMIPQKFNKLRDVIQFFQGKEDRRYIINQLVASKPISNKLDHVWSYVQLRKDHNAALNELQRLLELKTPGVKKVIEQKKQTLKKLEHEISFYER